MIKTRKSEMSKMLDEERRVTIGYVYDNNQNVEMKVPHDGFEASSYQSVSKRLV